MSELIVDGLEVVEIDGDHGQVLVLPFRSSNLILQALFPETAVVEAGEGIDDGHAVKSIRAHALFLSGVHLSGEAMPKEFELVSLIEREGLGKQEYREKDRER